MRIYFSCLIALLIPALSWAALTTTQKLDDLHELQAIIAADYGPLQFKREHLGLDLDALTRNYEERIPTTTSDDDFRYLLMQFIAEFRDSHFNGRVPSTNESSLGFSTDFVQGKVVIEDIDRSRLSQELFPFTRGDEIVRFDDVPVEQIVAKLQTYNGMGSEETARKIAVYFLPKREAKVVPVPTGYAKISVRRKGSSNLAEVSLPWQSKKDSFSAVTTLNKVEAKGPVGKGDWCSEQSRITPPPGSRIVPNVPFTALTFPTAKGRIGFIRIPHYYPVDKASGQEVAALRFGQYEKVIQEFESETVGLIIDQDYNCGGSILYVNKMLSLFLRAPFMPADFQFRASQTQVDGLSRHLAKFPSTADGYKKFSRLIEEIKKAKDAGEAMSPKIPVHGVMEVSLPLSSGDIIEPNAIRYSKPIVLLINEMSGSGGDLFPAMMKDHERAYLIGNHTMGAGGHAWDDPHMELKYSKLTVNLTRSLIYRPNGAAIENSGITPNTFYEITMEDFMNGYAPYLSAATARLLGLL